MLHLLLQANEVTPDHPAELAWPAVAGGVAAIVTTTAIVLGAMWRGWRKLRTRLIDPMTKVIIEWNGTEETPGIIDRFKCIERHVGNGYDKALRDIVSENAAKITHTDAHLNETRAVAERADREAAIGQALAKQTASALASHYVEGHYTDGHGRRDQDW